MRDEIIRVLYVRHYTSIPAYVAVSSLVTISGTSYASPTTMMPIDTVIAMLGEDIVKQIPSVHPVVDVDEPLPYPECFNGPLWLGVA